MSSVSETDKNEPKQEAEKMVFETPDEPNNQETTEESFSADKKAKYQELCNIEKELDAEIEKMKAQLEAGPSMKETMNLLHEYNEIKDAAQKVLGAIANMQGVTIASLHKEYNLPIDEH
ncbi:DNA repair protein SWI5 homolog [Venturia canescens]|uniref:DNA repair protein SWI5 homolog n=1 Tax=Venturia canescens TaxID=32260 RepID=UPI001C9D33E4|nr:DNA repair protein SWI5 homolog [Venturia canescens]